VIIAGIALGAKLAHGAQSRQVLLRHELREQQCCALDEFLLVREMPVGNVVGLEGRIRCIGTREFDFRREHANQRFTIHLCQPVVC
jgi:hypothetical protein